MQVERRIGVSALRERARALRLVLTGRPPEVARRLAGRLLCRFDRDRSVLARLTPGEIRTVAASPAVESVEANHVCTLAREPAEASSGIADHRRVVSALDDPMRITEWLAPSEVSDTM